MFGMWSPSAILNLLWSSASIGTLVGCAAVFVAVALPAPLARITDLRKWAIVVAVIAFGYSATFTRGMNHGLAVKQAEWDSGLVKEADRATTDRSDAERAVGPLPSDRSVFRNDPFNRNRDGAAVICTTPGRN